MGWITQGKVQAIATHAQRALAEGHTVFVCRINQAQTGAGFSGPLSGMAEQVEAIEALGWTMESSSFAHTSGRNVCMYVVFRRGQDPRPPQNWRGTPGQSYP